MNRPNVTPETARDLAAIGGLVLVVVGLWLWHPAVALVFAGAVTIGLCVLWELKNQHQKERGAQPPKTFADDEL